MPIPWLVVLQSVPWADVVKNAPKVADGAKKLWNAIGKQSPLAAETAASAAPTVLSDEHVIDTVRRRLTVIEAAAADLHGQMLASSELIKALAEQNTQLIQRIEANRVRVVWLAGALAIVGILAASSLVLLLFR
ncbi:hypothetical protein [Thiobacillus sp.]